MKNLAPKIALSERDFYNLTQLIEKLPMPQEANLKALEEELDRAEVVATEALPDDVVRMNSVVSYEDLDSGRVITIQLSYPTNANIAQKRISVLAPIGSALIGLKVGEVIKWPLPGGNIKQLRVRQLIAESQIDAS